MRHVRRAIAILIGFAAGFVATASVAYASLTTSDPAVAPADPGRPLWQILAFAALGVLLAVAIVGLGYSRSRSRKSQTPLRS
jgi:mannose/fructose/N-acetylgalactosamine-specific phosphotransferase system component IIC